MSKGDGCEGCEGFDLQKNYFKQTFLFFYFFKFFYKNIIFSPQTLHTLHTLQARKCFWPPMITNPDPSTSLG